MNSIGLQVLGFHFAAEEAEAQGNRKSGGALMRTQGRWITHIFASVELQSHLEGVRFVVLKN